MKQKLTFHWLRVEITAFHNGKAAKTDNNNMREMK